MSVLVGEIIALILFIAFCYYFPIKYMLKRENSTEKRRFWIVVFIFLPFYGFLIYFYQSKVAIRNKM